MSPSSRPEHTRDVHAVSPMTERDVSTVAAIERSSFPQPTPSRLDPLPTSEARLREELSRPWTHAWVVRGDNGRAVAFLVAWHVVDEVHVLQVATLAGHRRRGIASALMAEVVRFAGRERARHILLEVRRSNEAAIRMYRTAGFFATGIRRRYYPNDEDAVTMALTLDSRTGDILRRPDTVRLDA